MDDAERAKLKGIYSSAKVIAVVGASGTERKAANAIPAYLIEQGYDVRPVNPRGGLILGREAAASLSDIAEHIDIVDVFRPAEEAMDIARAAVAAKADVLWFQLGTDTDEAVAFAEKAGVTVVRGRCIGDTHEELGLGPGPADHD